MIITDVKYGNGQISFEVDGELAAISLSDLPLNSVLDAYKHDKMEQLEKLKDIFYSVLGAEDDDTERPFKLSYDDVSKIMDVVLGLDINENQE